MNDTQNNNYKSHMKSSKVTKLRNIVHEIRKEEEKEQKKYKHSMNLWAISLGYAPPYPDILTSNHVTSNDESL